MKTCSLLLSLAALSLPVLQAQDAAKEEEKPKAESFSLLGSWQAVAITDTNELKSTVTFSNRDGKLAGNSKSVRGELDYESVKQDGKNVVVGFSFPLGENKLKVVLKAEFKDAHRMTGKWVVTNSEGDAVSNGDWKASRIFDPVGTWKVVSTNNGRESTSELVIERKDGILEARNNNGDDKAEYEITLDGTDLKLDRKLGRGSVVIDVTFKDANHLVGGWIYYDPRNIEAATDFWRATRVQDQKKK